VRVGDADRDAIEPGPEGRVAAEARDRSEDLDEHLLEKVVDLDVRSEHPVEDHVHAPPLSLEELTVGGLLARHAASGEIDVVSSRARVRDDRALHSLTVADHEEKVTPNGDPVFL
jgi:hypothetical protein